MQPRLAEAGATWLEAALADVERRPDALAQHFSAVSRRCGRDPLSDDDPQGLRHGCIDDAARSLLMGALALRGADRANLLDDLYRHGDAGEKRGVLRGLRRLDEPGKPGERDTPGEPGGIGAALLPIVEDALRTNDVRLVAAAVQGYGARYLGQEAYRHAVVKCVFTGIPLGAIANLADRQDAELARMLVDLAHERTAAGRDIPTDIHAVVGAFPQALDRPDLSVDLLSALLPATHVYKE
nr:EboA domain-containing protein [Cryobacterium roopkundense]